MFAVTGQHIPRAYSQPFAEAKGKGFPSAPSVTLVWRPDRTVHLVAGLTGAVTFPFFVLASVSSGLPFGIAAAFAIAHLAATAPSVGLADRVRLNTVLSALAAFWAGVCVLMVSAGFSPVSFLAEAIVSMVVAAVPLISRNLSGSYDGRTRTARELSCLDAYSINEAVIVTDKAGTILGSSWAARDRVKGLDGRDDSDVLQFVDHADRNEFTAAMRKCIDSNSPQECCIRVFEKRRDDRINIRMTPITGDRIAVSLSPAPGNDENMQSSDPTEQVCSQRGQTAEPITVAAIPDPKKRDPANVSDVIDFAMRLMRQEADYAGLCVELKETDPDLTVACDRRTLIQIVANILGNAIKFSNFAGLVTVSYASVDGAGVIRITDEGIGFGQDNQPRVFDEFRDSADDARDGRGVDMAIVDDLVKENGGSIQLTSQTGLGTTIEISLPLQEEFPGRTCAVANGHAVAIAAK